MAERNENLAKAFTDYSRKEERKEINPFSGNIEVPTRKWSSLAVTVKAMQGWTNQEKKIHFSAMLSDYALPWHIKRLKLFQDEVFEERKKSIPQNFSHPSEFKTLKMNLKNKKSETHQLREHFIEEIENMYDEINEEHADDFIIRSEKIETSRRHAAQRVFINDSSQKFEKIFVIED